MSKIGDLFGYLFLSLLLVWVTGMIFSPDRCTRVYRSSWPVTYSMGAIELLAANWISDESKLELLKKKANFAVGMQTIFETTVYGDKARCKK